MGIYEEIKQKLSEVDNSIMDLFDVADKIESRFDREQIMIFHREYPKLVKKTGDMMKEILNNKGVLTSQQFTNLMDSLDKSVSDLNYVYDTVSRAINLNITEKVFELEDNVKNHQGLQLAVFSIVLSILAFVLTNAKILAADGISFRNVMLVNLSFILAADVFFSLIYLFMGPVFYSTKGGLRWFIFAVLPILLIIAIVLISVLVPA